MEISSYTSNIQPYGSSGGIKLASDSEDANNNSVSTQRAEATQKEESDKKAKRQEQLEKPELVSELAKKRNDRNKEELEKLMETMGEFVNSINKGLSFRIDEDLGRDVVTIYEASTGDVIRQIPDEEMLIILRRLAARNSGLFIEEKA